MKNLIKIVITCFLMITSLTLMACNSGYVSSENDHDLPNSSTNSAFDTQPQISIVAEMGEDIIGYPKLNATIKNNSSKDIVAIKFYVQYYNVYGEKITSILDANKLYSDNTITSGSTKSLAWTFYENKIKFLDLYLYSVYYSDGTEWGDRNATKSTILSKGWKMRVE